MLTESAEFDILLDFSRNKGSIDGSSTRNQYLQHNFQELERRYYLRRNCIDQNIPVFTDLELVRFVVKAYNRVIYN